MVTTTPTRRFGDERGFSLVEFLIATAITSAVLGGTIVIAAQLQQVYRTQLDDVTLEEEARFALDWIAQAVRNAGSNPYEIQLSNCPIPGTIFQPIRIDPNANLVNDDIRLQADLTGSPTAIPPITGPDALLGGTLGACNQASEDITIAFADDGNPNTDSVITRLDNNLGGPAAVMTEPIFTQLLFTYLNAARVVTANPSAIAYVRISVTAQSQATRPGAGARRVSTLQTEVRVRTR